MGDPLRRSSEAGPGAMIRAEKAAAEDGSFEVTGARSTSATPAQERFTSEAPVVDGAAE